MNEGGFVNVAEPILSFLESTYSKSYLQIYEDRVRQLMLIQQDFNASPSLLRLGDSSRSVDRVAYNITLLASIVFTNHRYEIMSQLNFFLQMVKKPSGVIASIGMGTGYETMLAANALNGWRIEGYDTDVDTHKTAARLLDFFDVSKKIELYNEFPLYDLQHDRVGIYDAIIFCEILEHLLDPLMALKSLKRALKPKGYIFLTMAVNIAQEDHIYWYPDIKACRLQIADAGLSIVGEKISPVTREVIPKSRNREVSFASGNYIALVSC
ncbi:class I SAM-dependent methyltransferase [Pseudomonadota bacterium]